MNLANVDAQDFVRSSAGGGGGNVDVQKITEAATAGAVKAAVPAATQAATQAVLGAVPALVEKETVGLEAKIKQGIKLEDVYLEYQHGRWKHPQSDVISGAGNNAVYRFNFPKPFTSKPVIELDPESNANRFYRLTNVSETGFDWSTNYSGTDVVLNWQAYIRKP